MDTIEKAARSVAGIEGFSVRRSLTTGWHLTFKGEYYPPISFDTDEPPKAYESRGDAEDASRKMNREFFVRAVLEAIREPSDDTLLEGASRIDFADWIDQPKQEIFQMRKAWSAMIDEILKPRG